MSEETTIPRLRPVARPEELGTLARVDERTLYIVEQLAHVRSTQQTLNQTIADHAKALRTLSVRQARQTNAVAWFTTSHVAAYIAVSFAAVLAAFSIAIGVAHRIGWLRILFG